MTTRDEALGFAKQLKAAGVNMSAYPGWDPESDMFIKASLMIHELADALFPKSESKTEKKDEEKRELPPTPPIESKEEKEKKERALGACARARELADRFWYQYPIGHRLNQKKCTEKILRLYTAEKNPEEFAKQLLDGLKAWCRCERWQRGVIVAPLVFLNQRRWEDTPPDNPRPANVRAVSQTANTHANGKVAW